MSYIYLTSQESNLWADSLKEIKHISLTLNDFEVIFHCNSYFKDIAGTENDQFTTNSTLVGLDKKGKYHFIETTEHVSYLDYLPSSYETKVHSFNNHEKLLHFLGNDWEQTKRYIFHYLLGDEIYPKKQEQAIKSSI